MVIEMMKQLIENRFISYIVLMILMLLVSAVFYGEFISNIFGFVTCLIIGTIFFLLLFPKQDTRWKLLQKAPMMFSRCKGCGNKFGFSHNMDYAGTTISDNIRYRCENQPKWIALISGKKYFYCSDKCLSKDFARTNGRYTKYKRNPSKRFRLNLTRAYKLNKQII